MNPPLSILKGLRHSALGCRLPAATLGNPPPWSSTPTGAPTGLHYLADALNIFPTLSRASARTRIVSAARSHFYVRQIVQSLIAQFRSQIFHAAIGNIVAAVLRQFSRDGIMAAMMVQCPPKESRP